MTTLDAKDYFKRLATETQNKSELKIYNEFIAILTDLKNKELSETQFEEIDQEIDRLALNSISSNNKKHFKKKLCAFKKFLREEYSLIPNGYYQAHWMTLGMSFGVGIGLAIGTSISAGSGTSMGLSIGIGIGMAFGLAFGAAKDAESKKQGLVIETKLK